MKKNHLCKLLSVALLSLSLTACGDDKPSTVIPEQPEEPGTQEPDDPNNPDEPKISYSIYATGYSDVILQAYWWKTGDSAMHDLSNASESAEANAITVTDDGTVYIGGTYTTDAMGGFEAATLWKNGEPTLLTKMDRPTDAAVYGLDADGNDIWAAGFYRYPREEGWSFQRDAAVIWKNGEQIDLTHGESYAKAWDVQVVDNTVYVAGEWSNADGYAVATIWKGNKLTTDWSDCEKISLSDGSTHAYAEGLYVDGTDVYATGYKSLGGESKVAVLWKNGEEIILSSNESYAMSVTASKGKVYVAGWEYVEIEGRKCAVATVWVNGEAQHLYDQPHSSQARCVAVMGNDVCVSGFIGDQAVIWVNGTAGALTDGTHATCITSIYLKKN